MDPEAELLRKLAERRRNNLLGHEGSRMQVIGAPCEATRDNNTTREENFSYKNQDQSGASNVPELAFNRAKPVIRAATFLGTIAIGLCAANEEKNLVTSCWTATPHDPKPLSRGLTAFVTLEILSAMIINHKEIIDLILSRGKTFGAEGLIGSGNSGMLSIVETLLVYIPIAMSVLRFLGTLLRDFSVLLFVYQLVSLVLT